MPSRLVPAVPPVALTPPAPARVAAWDRSLAFATFVESADENGDLWRSGARRAVAPEGAVERLRAIGRRWRLLVLLEDWCGDAVNTIPVLAALAAAAPELLELRVLSRDAEPDLMDAHLSPTGGRAIPVVMVLDEHLVERAWWGSRPAPLQALVQGVWAPLDKPARYAEARRWYVRDRGVTAVDELLALMARAAA